MVGVTYLVLALGMGVPWCVQSKVGSGTPTAPHARLMSSRHAAVTFPPTAHTPAGTEGVWRTGVRVCVCVCVCVKD